MLSGVWVGGVYETEKSLLMWKSTLEKFLFEFNLSLENYIVPQRSFTILSFLCLDFHINSLQSLIYSSTWDRAYTGFNLESGWAN